MEESDKKSLLEIASKFPLPPGVKFSYGTAGFRAEASLLSSAIFRVGILAALRSLKTKSFIGLMITASHNPVNDNGIKVADPSGGMLSQDWEPFADAMVNAENPESFVKLIDDFITKEGISFGGSACGEVLVGRDTRPSGEELLKATIQGIRAVKGMIATDMGVLTTPQLHWMVRNRNKGIPATEFAYYTQLSQAARTLIQLNPQGSVSCFEGVVVDGANGVGAEKLICLQRSLEDITVEIRNTGDKADGYLNDNVGADFIQKEKIAPLGFGEDDVGKRCASLDGDADRLVYFYLPSSERKNISLIDGDKILTLFAIFIKQQLDSILVLHKPNNASQSVTLGIVQTAYANGASTEYLQQIGLDVAFTPTGVKYLHEKAAEYDIGIYFEANGHGTILFSEKLLAWLEQLDSKITSTMESTEDGKAVKRLLAISSLINQAVGDALSGMLLVEVILRYNSWSIQNWSGIYEDFPSRQLKVKVADRTSVITTDAERRVARPKELQEAIDKEVAKYSSGRAFVRPSGTEDVVRVYAEALKQEEANKMAQDISLAVQNLI